MLNISHYFCCLALAIILMLPGPKLVLATDSPTLTANRAYVGSLEDQGQVRLWLLPKNFFVLQQFPDPKDKDRPPLCLTGNWQQLDQGRILQLTNTSGLHARFNIGGRGNLYGCQPVSQNKMPQTLVLKPASFAPPLFTLIGTLHQRQGKLVLTDSASGVSFCPVRGAEMAELAPSGAVMIEAEVVLEPEGIRIKKLQSLDLDYCR